MRSLRRLHLRSIAVLFFIQSFVGVASADPIDFTTFTMESYPLTNAFPLAEWMPTQTTATLNNNASASFFYGSESALNKRFIGTLDPGSDDDMVGFVLGFNPGDADFFTFPNPADFLLIDWKGATQTFDFTDAAGEGIFFHDQTLGTTAPAGLALSRVTGLATADELWSHIDSVDNPDGGVEELARGATFASTGYPRSTPIQFDIQYTETKVVVSVDGVEQFNVSGSFSDGGFGLYSGWQGPQPLFADFEVFDLDELLAVTVDRDSGEVQIANNTGAPAELRGYSILSTAGSLNASQWTPITGNLDGDGDGSVDSEPWAIVESTEFELSEGEAVAGNGGAIGDGQTLSLGSLWTKSPFEDLQVQVQLLDGSTQQALIEFENGPGGQAFVRSDLNTDGVVDENDWPLFQQNTLADLSSLSPANAYLLGDLDGDGDNDVFDFSLFKGDFDAANGIGAFEAMLAGVPEPAGVILLLTAILSLFAMGGRHTRVRRLGLALLMLTALTNVGGHQEALSQEVDFTTFTAELFPPSNAFPDAVWTPAPDSATLNSNASANVFYGPDNVLGKRITGTLSPGSDDDIVGFVLGFNPGDATLGSGNNADYLLIDWKGVDQTFNFTDTLDPDTLHDLTDGSLSPAGLALSRVRGLPTADELWSHSASDNNPMGGVEELARGATLGSNGYDRSGVDIDFDIRFSENQVIVSVDGVEQLNETGTFGDGRFGLYTGWQGPAPTFSDFEITDLDAVLTATVHRDTREIELANNSDSAIEFDFYQLSSESESLDPDGWNSLSDQGFQTTGPGPGESWDEAGGSSDAALAELYLQAISSLAAAASVSLGNAYDNRVDGQDLELIYRLSDGTVTLGSVEYVGEPSTDGADFDRDGDVDGDDFLAWQAAFGCNAGCPVDADGDDDTDGDDFLVWQAQFGSGVTSTASATAVPEPACLLLLSLALLGGACRFRRG